MLSPDQSSSRLPPVIKRLTRWFWLPAVAAAVGLGSLAFSSVPRLLGSLPVWSAVAISLFFFAPTFTAMFFVWRGNRRVRSRYLAAKGRLCTSCTYSLLGLPDAGHCPECAAPYDVLIDATAWQLARMPAIAGAPARFATPSG